MTKYKIITLKVSPEKLAKIRTKALTTSDDTQLSVQKPKSKAKSNKPNTSSSKLKSVTPSTPMKLENAATTSTSTTVDTATGLSADTTSTSDQSTGTTGDGPRKWKKKPLVLQSFTGFQLAFKCWNGGPKDNASLEAGTISEKSGAMESVEGASKSKTANNNKGSGLKIQIKLNNRKFELNKQVKNEEEGTSSSSVPAGEDTEVDLNSSALSSVVTSRAVSPIS